MRLQTAKQREEYREAYVARLLPSNAVKVKFKGIEAEAYLYKDGGRGDPCACFFIGNSARPAWRYYFNDEAQRERRIKQQVEALQARAKAKADYAATRKDGAVKAAKVIEVGHIFVTCWGYDQTNREFFKVIEKKGQMVTVQEVAQISNETGWLQGRAVPGENFRDGSKPLVCKLLSGPSIKPEGHYASIWEGKPVNWTAYH